MSDNSFIVLGASTSTWLRQKIDPRSWVRFFGEELMPEYKEKMELLREVDDKIFLWTEDLDKIIKAMKKALDQGQLIDLAVLLTNLNNKMLAVSFETNRVKDIAQEAITDFESQRGSNKLWGKEAGLIDDLKRKFFYSKLTNKSFLKERHAVLRGIINLAEKTVNQIKEILKVMTDARVQGEIGQYITEANKINKIQQNFQFHFTNVYNKYLKSLVDQIQAKQQAQQPVSQENLLPEYKEPEVTVDEPEVTVDESTKSEKSSEDEELKNVFDVKKLQEAAKKINLPEHTPLKLKKMQPILPSKPTIENEKLKDIKVTSSNNGMLEEKIAKELITSILTEKLSKEETVNKIINAAEEMELINNKISSELCQIANKLLNE